MVIHGAQFSALVVQISLLKMWHTGPTSECLDWNVFFLNISSFFFFLDRQFILCHMSTTVKNKYVDIYFIILDYL